MDPEGRRRWKIRAYSSILIPHPLWALGESNTCALRTIGVHPKTTGREDVHRPRVSSLRKISSLFLESGVGPPLA